MSGVIVEQSMSLDGFSAGANDGPGNGLGDNGERLHDWMFADATAENSAVLDAYWSRVGAVILGRRMFDNGFEPWGRTNPWGVPAFVLCHEARQSLAGDGSAGFTFVPDGIQHALERAVLAAGDKAVAIAGGANTVQQYIAAGLVDEINLHVVPILLGGGVRFFDWGGESPCRFEITGTRDGTGVSHLTYRRLR